MKPLTSRERGERWKAKKLGLPVEFRPRGRVATPIWDRITKTSTCWLYTGKLNRDGYGSVCRNYRGHMVHRLVWEELVGPIPSGAVLMHTCDVPNCVNPEHLRVGTQADNVRDKVEKSRQARGERNNNALLTAEDVAAIRASYASDVRSYNKLAARYGVTKHCIYRIVKRHNWRHVA